MDWTNRMRAYSSKAFVSSTKAGGKDLQKRASRAQSAVRPAAQAVAQASRAEVASGRTPGTRQNLNAAESL